MELKYVNSRNPILPPSIHVPDGEGHVMPDGKLYIYGSFDKTAGVYCSGEYHVVSTPDLKEWTIHDKSFDTAQVSWYGDGTAAAYVKEDWKELTPFFKKLMGKTEEGKPAKETESASQDGEETEQKENAGVADVTDAAKEATDASDEQQVQPHTPLLYAPDCIYKDGTYYLYFCLDDGSEGVAVSNRPQGPFTDPVKLPCGGIDPAIFVDEDGEAYYYWGQMRSHGVHLNRDMVSFDREKIVDNLVTEEEHFFHEGSSMRKIGTLYYYVFADMERGKPTSLGYATSTSPLGPFTYRGILIDNADCDPESWNNHGSIECINGQWYVIYHRSSRGSQFFRRVCMEKIEILPDGTIPEVKMTSQGPGEPFGSGEEIPAFRACGLKGNCRIMPSNETSGGTYEEQVEQILSGDEIIFRYVKSKEGKPFTKAVLKTEGTGEVCVLLDEKEVGRGKLAENGVTEITLWEDVSGRKQELKLVFVKAERTTLQAVTLY